SIKVIQVRAHKSSGGGNFSRVRQQVDVKMRHRSGRGGDFVPAMANDPANEFCASARCNRGSGGALEKITIRSAQKRRPGAVVVCASPADNHESFRQFPGRRKIPVRDLYNTWLENRRTIRDLETPDQSDRRESRSRSKVYGQRRDHSLDNCELSTAARRPFSVVSYS